MQTLQTLLEPIILAGIIDADREDLIQQALKKLNDDSLSYANKICWAAELHELVDQRSEIVLEALQDELNNKIN